MANFTAQHLVAAGFTGTKTAESVAESLGSACDRFGIDTPLRLAGFLSQCAHESVGFKVTQENLNYSAQALVRVFPKRFDGRQAIEYQRQPERIANRAYADRMGNGPEASGDGWRFRGRGFIQLTGRTNYAAFGKALDEDVLADPSAVASPRLAALSAAWFWQTHRLNELADAKDVLGMTKRINGGTNGLEERERLYKQAIAVLCP